MPIGVPFGNYTVAVQRKRGHNLLKDIGNNDVIAFK
jgi:hypothetical protein